MAKVLLEKIREEFYIRTYLMDFRNCLFYLVAFFLSYDNYNLLKIDKYTAEYQRFKKIYADNKDDIAYVLVSYAEYDLKEAKVMKALWDELHLFMNDARLFLEMYPLRNQEEAMPKLYLLRSRLKREGEQISSLMGEYQFLTADLRKKFTNFNEFRLKYKNHSVPDNPYTDPRGVKK